MNQSLSQSDRWTARRTRLTSMLRQGGPRGLAHEIKQRGFRGTLAYAVRQLRYSICIAIGRRWDARFGVDTGGQIELRGLNVVGAHKALGAPAVSTSPKTFRFLSRYLPQARDGVVYVDLGSGKGRTLFLAGLMGFERVIGVEFSADLCAVARDNVASFRALGVAMGACSVVHADATEYELPPDDLVLFFCNPFALELWPAMVENIVRSYRQKPRAITLVVAGSQEGTIRGAGRLLAAREEFERVAGGTAPYFLDTYLPYHFECFKSVDTGASRLPPHAG